MDTESLIEVRVARKTVEAEGIAGFCLVPTGGTLPPFDAGAHIDVHLPGGLVRQYSLCGPPQAVNAYHIGVLHDAASRGGSRTMHELVNEGDVLRIGQPKNHFRLNEGAARSLLFAGGIGVTPIIAMADRLAAIGADFEFHYCTRSQARTAFMRRLLGSAFASKVRFHFDDGAAEQKLDFAATLAHPGAQTHLYVCGPNGFLDTVCASARAIGWSDAQIHFEYFAGQQSSSTGDSGFELELRQSGRVIRVEAEQTCVDALAAIGVEIPTSCRQGVCGTCLTGVIDGLVDHRDLYLLPDEQAANDKFLPCCSRAKSPRLVIDL
ncbi:PDR/VanB family oxidoreductase [Cupriavidus lacunae]|uniref:Oxidoreductase n=1 Tax=Cupriavidus lacunae TaxID=2666307 RepID=A0A370NR67_9BURK|nr:PDR/VanB family oxidoreductase [Cupriavidus lacunae]RDK08112.1 oxidoreductase [Cupriavidus lacunae]